MAATKLSAQDKKDLDKFTKYLVYKCIQVIVQSRLGEKIKSHSKPVSSGSDWFNLSIRDLPEVFGETKKVFTGSTLTVGQTVCVEISLRTAEGDTMVLETWSITMTEQCDLGARVSYTVYNRMGILLKSLMCVSRVTPAYRLSRKQGPETYVICYRIYMGEPQMVHLGEGYQTVKVGGVPTPIGTVTLTSSYRTKLLISPQPLVKDLSIDLKDDHFTPDASPRKSNAPRPCLTAYRERRLSSCEHEDGACSDPCETCATSFSTSPPDGSPYFLGSPTRPAHRQPSDEDFQVHFTTMNKQPSFSQGQKMGAFAPVRLSEPPGGAAGGSDYEDVPFLSLLTNQQHENMEVSGGRRSGGSTSDGADSATDATDTATTRSSTSSAGKSTSSQHSANEDFVMVELKTPFAGQDANTDLGRFYRECQGAPNLMMFSDQGNMEDTLNAITDQLAMFEATAKDFDEFVEKLAEEDEET